MLRGVDQIDIWHPERLVSPHRTTPQRCPDVVAVTVQPAASAWRSAFSMSFLGCLALATLTRYNGQPHVFYLGGDDLPVAPRAGDCEQGPEIPTESCAYLPSDLARRVNMIEEGADRLSEPAPNSGVLVLPMMIAPAALRRWT